jgi:hypothetical protein
VQQAFFFGAFVQKTSANFGTSYKDKAFCQQLLTKGEISCYNKTVKSIFTFKGENQNETHTRIFIGCMCSVDDGPFQLQRDC